VSTKLSVVATSRNDDHGGNLLARMQWFVDGLAEQAARYRVPTELVLVEWNPPADRPPLAEAMRWPADGVMTTRVVTVPKAVHDEVPHADTLPLFQMIAKNVGIRRAAGEFVLATNIDILFSDALFEYLAGPLASGILYRADRHDIDFPVTQSMSVREALEYCAAHPRRIVRKDGIYYPDRGRVVPTYQGFVDFAQVQGKRLLRRARGGRVQGRGPEQAAQQGQTGLKAVAHRAADRLDAVTAMAVVPKLHINACGDFTLLSRDDWFALRGYPEWPMFSWNLDSVFLYQARAHGLRLVELPPEMAMFHIEHGQGSGWTPEGRETLFQRIERSGTPYLGDDDLRKRARRITLEGRRGRPPIYNDQNWGFVSERLPDVTTSSAGTHGRPVA